MNLRESFSEKSVACGINRCVYWGLRLSAEEMDMQKSCYRCPSTGIDEESPRTEEFWTECDDCLQADRFVEDREAELELSAKDMNDIANAIAEVV